MYLERKIYIGSGYEHRHVTGTIDITVNTGMEHEKKLDIPFKNVSEIIVQVAYWRKANQIHAWITQDWDDDVTGEISGKRLIELSGICEKVIESLDKQEMVEKEVDDYWHKGQKTTIKTWPNTDLAEELLPTQQGFFFGSYNISDWYLEDLKDTVEQLKDIDPEEYYMYTASY